MFKHPDCKHCIAIFEWLLIGPVNGTFHKHIMKYRCYLISLMRNPEFFIKSFPYRFNGSISQTQAKSHFYLNGCKKQLQNPDLYS